MKSIATVTPKIISVLSGKSVDYLDQSTLVNIKFPVMINLLWWREDMRSYNVWKKSTGEFGGLHGIFNEDIQALSPEHTKWVSIKNL